MRLEVIFLVKKQKELEKKIYRKESVCNFLREKEQKGRSKGKESVKEYW